MKKVVSHKRHVAKTITYRILGTCTTFVVGWVTTGDIIIGASIGSADFFIKIVLYYAHERAWYRSKFGIEEPLIEPDQKQSPETH